MKFTNKRLYLQLQDILYLLDYKMILTIKRWFILDYKNSIYNYIMKFTNKRLYLPLQEIVTRFQDDIYNYSKRYQLLDYKDDSY